MIPVSVQLDGLFAVAIILPSAVAENGTISLAATPLGGTRLFSADARL